MVYIPLHGHSTFSFLEAIGTVKKIAQKVKKMELPAIAITDYNGMYGAVQFYNLSKELVFKPIIWVELWFVMDVSTSYTAEHIWTICLLAKNKIGYHNLMKLVSFANTTGITPVPKIDMAVLKVYADGIIAFMWWELSRIGKMIHNGESLGKIEEIIVQLQDILGKDSVFLEITAQDHKAYPALVKINPMIISLAQKMSLSCIVNNNYFYINKKDKKAWEAALAIKDNMKLYDPTRRMPPGKHHIMKEEEIVSICLANGFTDEQVQQRLATNSAIADSIDTQIDLGSTYFPYYDPPQDIKDLYAQHEGSLVEGEW